jgi:hypothetical protein
MKNSRAIAIVILIAGIIGFYFFEKQNFEKQKNVGALNSTMTDAVVSENNSNALAATENPGTVPATSPDDLASHAASPNSIPATNDLQNLPPFTVLDKTRVAIHNYNSAFGENPVGTNPEITAALMGKNPKQINFITPESGLRVNDRGELVDAYGTPFFFHQLSGQEMEIRSAGEDRKMWTFDDLVTK